MSAWNRLRALFLRDRLDRDLDDEIRLHMELAIEDYMRRGCSPAEARRMARLKFGAIDASKTRIAMRAASFGSKGCSTTCVLRYEGWRGTEVLR